ncbi:MAG: hypothetical protein M5U34_09285 [Chloroflexi bacterium]|nr:hypothetical protein [Chloroflexota bacterium]
MVDLYSLSLKLGVLAQARIEVVADERHDEVILGRDILNHLVVTLNRPGNAVEAENLGTGTAVTLSVA